MSGPDPLTLMVVHAHPDDEASSTGGILAHYARLGVQTVLVTCTDGALGDGPGGIKPDHEGHHPEQVRALRQEELARSCEELGVSHLELLGYGDSGMRGWESNDRTGSFWRTPIEPVADRLRGLFATYRPQVVVTYDPTGFYGHPDHIQTHRVTAAAFASSPIPQKLYCPTIPRSRFAQFDQALASAGMEIERPSDTDAANGNADPSEGVFVSDDDQIAAWIDCSEVVGHKLAALRAHASQADNVFFLRLPTEVFARFFGTESFVRWRDRTGHPLPEDDLFAGVR